MTDPILSYSLLRIQHQIEGEKRRLLHQLERDILAHPQLDADPRCVVASIIEQYRDALRTPERAERAR